MLTTDTRGTLPFALQTVEYLYTYVKHLPRHPSEKMVKRLHPL